MSYFISYDNYDNNNFVCDPAKDKDLVLVNPTLPNEPQQQGQIQIKIPFKATPYDSEAYNKIKKKIKVETPCKKGTGSAQKKSIPKTKILIEDTSEDFTYMIRKESKQNPERNMPSLIAMRARESLKIYFSLNPSSFKINPESDDSEMSRVRYLGAVIQEYNLTSQQLKELKEYAENFKTQTKTWTNVKKNLKIEDDSNKLYARVFVSCIIAMLSPIGKKDFDAWMGHGEVSSGKSTLRNNKETFKNKFLTNFSDLDLIKNDVMLSECYI